MSRDPVIGEPLPDASLAVIPHQKLTDYALDFDHDDGGPKAHVFATVLGIERSDWRYLHDAILEDLPRRPVSGAREPAHPSAVRTWEVMVRVEGLSGRPRDPSSRPKGVVKVLLGAYDRRPDGTPST